MTIPKSIGIKLYDDTFVPVLTEGEIKNKKITLTTVRDDQKKVIIELYEGTNNNCIHNEYLGKLTLPLDRSSEKGDPAFEVHLRLDSDGILYAKAWDTDTGQESEIKIEHSPSHTITHETLSDQQLGDLESSYDSSADTEKIISYDDDEKYVHKDLDKKNKPDLLIKIVLVLLAILLILAVVFLVRTCMDSAGGPITGDRDDTTELESDAGEDDGEAELVLEDEKPEVTEQDKNAGETEEDKLAREEEEKKQEKLAKLEEERKKKEEEQRRLEEEEERKKLAMEEQKKKDEEEAERKKKEAEEKERRRREEEKKKEEEKDVLGMKDPEGKEHPIRRGDNLWNICKRYYGDPWYYPHLAEINNIKNPRLIFAGQTLIIPPKNSMKRWSFGR